MRFDAAAAARTRGREDARTPCETRVLTT